MPSLKKIQRESKATGSSKGHEAKKEPERWAKLLVNFEPDQKEAIHKCVHELKFDEQIPHASLNHVIRTAVSQFLSLSKTERARIFRERN